MKIKGINIFNSYFDKNESELLLSQLNDVAKWEQAAVGKYENDKVSYSEIDLEFRDIEVSG